MPQLQQHDPFDVPVQNAEIRTTWLEILELPVSANDGKVFQYDQTSERLMKKAIAAWDAAGLTSMDWRLEDNTIVSVDKAGLQTYSDELEINQTLRGFVVDQEYVAFKTSGATRRELMNWKAGYSVV